MATNKVIIVNNPPLGFEDDFNAQANAYFQSCLTVGLDPVILSDDEARKYFEGGSDAKFVIFYEKDTSLSRYLEAKGIKVFNSSEAIEICDDKANTYSYFLTNNIRTPKTYIFPYTYGINLARMYDVEQLVLSNGIKYPFVLKKRVGSFGQSVYLIHDKHELNDLIDIVGSSPLLVQEFVEGNYGFDYRVNVVGDKVISVVKRVNEVNFKSNVHQGGHLEIASISEEAKNLAINAVKATKCDFAGVDIIFKDNLPYVLEVNSNARTVDIKKISGIDVTLEIIKHCNINS